MCSCIKYGDAGEIFGLDRGGSRSKGGVQEPRSNFITCEVEEDVGGRIAVVMERSSGMVKMWNAGTSRGNASSRKRRGHGYDSSQDLTSAGRRKFKRLNMRVDVEGQ